MGKVEATDRHDFGEFEAIQMYTVGLRKYPRGLSVDQEKFLFGSMQMGLPIEYIRDSYFFDSVPEDQQAVFRNALEDSKSISDFIVLSNLNLSLSYAYKFFLPDRKDIFPDIVQAANEGLIAAVKNYDPNHESNAKFGTYATTVIRDRVLEFLDKNRTIVTMGENVQAVMKKAKIIREKLYDQYGRSPTLDEVRSELLSMGFSNSRILSAIHGLNIGMDGRATSLDAIIMESEEDDEESKVAPADEAANVEREALDKAHTQEMVNVAKRILSQTEFMIFLLSSGVINGEPVDNYAEIGRRVGMSRGSVGKSLERIKGKLSSHPVFYEEAA